MEPIKVEFTFDFGSPNAYLAEKVIPEIERRTGVKFEYVPVLLGGIYKLTNNRSPGESLAGIKNKPEFMELETQRFIRRHNITTFRKNPFFPVNTLQLMRGAVAAQFEGVFEPYFRAAYHHMWEAPKKMDDPQVAREAFISSNIDFDRLFARSQQPDVKRPPAGAHAGRRRSRRVRLADLLRRQGNVLRQRPAARRGGSHRRGWRVGSKGTAANAGLKIATSDVQIREDALTTATDVMSAADILAGLPNRISEVIAPHVAERPTHPAFVEGGRTLELSRIRAGGRCRRRRFGAPADQAGRPRAAGKREFRRACLVHIRLQQARCLAGRRKPAPVAART